MTSFISDITQPPLRCDDRDPTAAGLGRQITLVAYRIEPGSMAALKALPRGAFRIREAERLDEVLDASRPGRACDLVLVGCAIGRQDPPERLESLRRQRPGQPIGMLCTNAQCAGDRTVLLMRAGLAGIFPTTMGTQALASAIRLVADGGRYAPPEMLVDLAVGRPGTEQNAGARPNGRLAGLSKREREVAVLLAQGLANKEIAFRLELQEVTIKVHATSIYRKLGVRNRAQAVARLLAGERGDRAES